MFDGVSYVDPNHDPIIHEGEDSATVIVMNAGPCTVELRTWTQPRGEGEPLVHVKLWPGNTKSVSGKLIRARATPDGPPYPIPFGPYAAIGWRVV